MQGPQWRRQPWIVAIIRGKESACPVLRVAPLRSKVPIVIELPGDSIARDRSPLKFGSGPLVLTNWQGPSESRSNFPAVANNAPASKLVRTWSRVATPTTKLSLNHRNFVHRTNTEIVRMGRAEAATEYCAIDSMVGTCAR
jgi:hypothetical protein